MASLLSVRDRPHWRTLIVFVGLSWICIGFAFRQAIWGGAILAPLDIPATLYSKYQWVNPTLGDVPQNHWWIDMFDYGLPRMYLAHQSLQANEFPWWDPYSGGGRPLVTEAHMSMSDPIRLLMFRLFPFLTAYNWTRIIQSFLTGLGMFLLLRFFAFSQLVTVLGALSFQFSGLQALLFYPENVPGSLLYYPFLWLALAKNLRTRPAAAVALGGLLCGAIFLSGNPQSHIYLSFFLLALAVGYATAVRDLIRIAFVIGGAWVVGCLIAAPILLAQVELFAISSREPQFFRFGKQLLTGLFSILGIFPWLTGSYQSIDLGKLVGNYGAAYVVHLGTPVLILSMLGLLTARKTLWTQRAEVRTAILLIVIYFIGICSTPLVNILYHRAAGLALLGLVVLFAAGVDTLVNRSLNDSRRILLVIILLLTVAVAMAHVFAFFIYPHVKDRALQFILEKEAANPTMASIPAVRRAQVNHLPRDISFSNPEALLAFLGALALLLVCSSRRSRKQVGWAVIFVFNIVSLVLFFHRTIPYSPINYWHALLQGGPEQQRLIGLLGDDLRLREQIGKTYSRLDYAFPGSTVIFYKVHTLLDYSSFPLTAPGQSGRPRDHNLLYTSEHHSASGEILDYKTNRVRFVWGHNEERPLEIRRETPNSIHLQIPAGPPGILIRTDTYYPGWHVVEPKTVEQQRNKEGFLSFAIPAEATDLILRYQPSYSGLTRLACLAGLITAAVALFWSAKKPGRQGG